MTKKSTAVAIPEGYSREDLIKLSGNIVSGSDEYLSGLIINKEVEDRDGKDVPVPSFYVTYPEVGRVYSERKKPIEIRPFVKAMRYEKWLEQEKKAQCTTIFFSWGEEIIDELGGTDKLNKPNDDKVKCKHLIYCTVSFKGTTAEGKEVDVKDFPTLLRVGGASFGNVMDLFDELGDDRILMQHPLIVDTYKSGPAYNFKLFWKDLTEELPITAADWDTLQNFRKEIDFFNKGITNKFKLAQKGSPAPEATDDEGEYEYIEGEDD